jgi:FAD/FMN-containing dehydrogenase
VAGLKDPKETAFYYRDAIIAQEYQATWTNPEEERLNIRWIKDLKHALSPFTTGDYVNWPDTLIKDWPTAYYGENFKRLREVKTRYDPCNAFKFPQSIPPLNKWG